MNINFQENASETIVFASEELSGYLNRMLKNMPEDGWEICLVSEAGCFGKSRNDSYAVRIGDKGGSIVGNNDRSVLLAVYDYLHYLGCRFLLPQKKYEIVPSITKEKLPAFYKKQASFYHRGVCIEGADSYENIKDYIQWMPKIGCSSFFLQFKTSRIFLQRYYSHEGNPYAEKEPYSCTNKDMEKLEQEIRKRGLLLHKAGHGWTGEALGIPTESWEPEEKAIDAAYVRRIAEINGTRKLYGGVPANTNLCYHNPDVKNVLANLVTDYASNHPYIDYLHVWLADEHNNLCECADCRKTTLSDQYVEILNEIDRRLSREDLNTHIVFLLYQELLWPPIVSRLNNPDRFALMFAPISRSFETSYDLNTHGKRLPEFRRNRIALPTELSENLAFLQEWKKIFAGDGFVYDYPLGRAHYGDFGYIHISKIIHSDIRKLSEMGLDGYISCQELRAALPNALPDYMMGYTLFQKDKKADDIIEEYFSACYGAAWEKVLAYLAKLSSLSSCDYVNGKGERCNPEIADHMERVKGCCVEFGQEIQRHRKPDGDWENIYWEVLEYHRNYVIMFSDVLGSLARGNMKQVRRKWNGMRDFICKNEKTYQPFLDVYRVLEVTKKYTGAGII